jgi:hypothetical protein
MAVMEKKDKVLQQIQASKTADSRAVQDAVSLGEPRPMCYGLVLPKHNDASMPLSSAAANDEWFSWAMPRSDCDSFYPSAEGTEACGQEWGRFASGQSAEACGLESTRGPSALGAGGTEACEQLGSRSSGPCGERPQVKQQESSRLTVLEAENLVLREITRASTMRANELETENLDLRNRLANLMQALDGTLAKTSSCAPATSAAPAADRIPDAAAATVFPRRKPGHTKREPCSAVAPVAVSLEVLESLASYSLPLAASKLGISATAMKKACRKLGISRWPYLPARAGRTFEAQMAQVQVIASVQEEHKNVEEQTAEDLKVPGPPPMPLSRSGSLDFVQSANKGVEQLGSCTDQRNLKHSSSPSPLPLDNMVWGGYKQE